MKNLVILLGLLLPISIFAKGFPDTTRRMALLIGNAQYQRLSTLKNPLNDVDTLATVLENLNFRVFTGKDLSYLEMKRLVTHFTDSLRAGDVALLYYAGMGVTNQEENYLIPIDAAIQSERDIAAECFSVETLMGQIANRHTKVNFFWMDACFSGFERLGTVKTSLPEDHSLLVYSGVSTVQDGDGKNSPFTQAMLKALKSQTQLVLKPEEVLDINELTRRVCAEVRQTTHDAQQPILICRLFEPFYLHQYTVNRR